MINNPDNTSTPLTVSAILSRDPEAFEAGAQAFHNIMVKEFEKLETVVKKQRKGKGKSNAEELVAISLFMINATRIFKTQLDERLDKLNKNK